MSMVEDKPEDDLRDKRMLLTRLVELESIITNALGIKSLRSLKEPPYKEIKPQPMNVESMAAKATAGSVQEVKKSRHHKLLPEHMIYKSTEEDRGMPRSEDAEVPEDSQDKDLGNFRLSTLIIPGEHKRR